MDIFSRVIAVTNGKGGVLKTTIATNIAGLLAQAGQKVLLIDLDPQGNAAIDLGFAKNEHLNDQGAALASSLLFGNPLTPVKDIRPGLDTIPSGEQLRMAMPTLTAKPELAKTALAKALAPLVNNYDLIIIDCPPGDQALQLTALAVARWVVIPIRSDITSIAGLTGVAQAMGYAREVNPTIDVLGVVFTSSTAGASNVARKARRNIEEALGVEKTAEVLISASIRHSDATAQSARDRGKLFHELEAEAGQATPFWQILRGDVKREDANYVPQAASNVAGDMFNVTNEILNRIQQFEAGE